MSFLLDGVLKKQCFSELMSACLKQDQLEVPLRQNVS